jgi:twitching motility protein PilT
MTETSLNSVISSVFRHRDDFSDLFFIVGKPLQLKAHGRLHSYPDDARESILQPAQVEQIAAAIMDGVDRLKRDFQDLGACDCSYVHEGARFRVNIFRQNGHHAIVMRKLDTEIPSVDGLKLQPIFREMITEKSGIIFLTGATGSGKSTTLAAMLNELNQTSAVHVVTLEDPIEFIHPHRKATFSQREFGRDFPSFPAGLRSALRQAPDVILVGEIRDRETMEIALTAAETGHMVYATLHTINAGQTINRILGLFTHDEEPLIRERIADTLRYIVSQRLVPKVGGGRIMINEIMGSNLRTRETLLLGEGENRSYTDIIEASAQYGWRTFDRALVNCYSGRLITEETAMNYSTNKNKVRAGIDRAKQIAGVRQIETSTMKLDIPDYEDTGSSYNDNRRDRPSVDLMSMAEST